MNLKTTLKKLVRRSSGVARFPFGRSGDPVLTMLPAHTEALSVRSVVGSVDRHAQLDRNFMPLQGLTPRLRAIQRAMEAGVTFPPIEVYRLHGVCYVVDGHHRVAAALRVGQLYLDAVVTECLIRAEGNEDAVEEARVGFALRTGLRSLAFGEAARYRQALAQIHEHRWYMGERGLVVTVQEAADDWYDNVYLPVIRQIISERLARIGSPEEAGDLYLQLCDLKYGVSRERGHDIGFAQTIREWAGQRKRRRHAGAMLGEVLRLSVEG